MGVILETKNLRKSFQTGDVSQKVICDMNLKIREEDFTVLMGASGAGKTTLLYMLSGMDTPTGGHIYFKGSEISYLSNNQLARFRRKNCGFVFQQSNLNTSLSVFDNVLVNGYLLNNERGYIRQRAKLLLEQMGIRDIHFNKYPNQISGGEAQRVAIVRGIINNPNILFADEPTGALNSQNTTEVLNLFTQLNNDGQTIIAVTHDVKTAVRGNRIIYVKDGIIKDELYLYTYHESEENARIIELQNFLYRMGW